MQQNMKTVYVIGLSCPKCKEKVKNALLGILGIEDCQMDGENIILSLSIDVSDSIIKDTIEGLGSYWVDKIES